MGIEMYGISAGAYLGRAKAAIEGQSQEGLFYAAYELRCCIEARQTEYIRAIRPLQGTKIKPWNIGENSKKIRKNSYADIIVRTTVDFGQNNIAVTYHTPVTDSIIEFSEKHLGKLLHSQQKFRPENDPWWSQTRAHINDAYRMIWISCQGDSLVPPMINSITGEVHVTVEQMQRNLAFFTVGPDMVGKHVRISVDHPQSLPADWVCDLCP